jgi:UDP-N-acetylmuramoylalanine--D-glutamate ligase
MHVSDFLDKKVTLMGLGRFLQGSGVGAAKWLIRHGAQVTITDLKNETDLKDSMDEVMYWFDKYKETYPNWKMYSPTFVMGEHRDQDFVGVDYVVQNPDVPRESEYVQLARKNKVRMLSDVAIFYELCPHPFVAITGAKGKSTTTSMIGDIFAAVDNRAVIAGNIKVSPLEHLDEILEDEEPRPIVLELSSWLLESLDEVVRGPEIVVLTNLYPDHLNRYNSFEHYKKAKEIIFKHQSADQWCVLNYDQEEVKEVAPRVPSKIVWFSKGEIAGDEDAVFVRGGDIVMRLAGIEEQIMGVDQIGVPGEHNVENALAAVAVAKLSGVSNELIAKSLSEFAGIPDRQEILSVVDEVTYVNDTTATAPAGAVAAMRRFVSEGTDKRKLVLLAGGADKGLPFEKMVEEIKKTCKFVVLFNGAATDELAGMIGDTVPSQRVDSMSEAMQVVSEQVAPGDAVLLSPGCASFGIFKNEFDRGDQFKEAVARL